MKEDINMLKKLCVVLILVLGFGLTYQVYATDTQVEPKFTVLSTKFVEKVEGVNEKGGKDSWEVKDPKEGLIPVMMVKVTADSDTDFFTSDFSLKYTHQGNTLNSDCIAITPGTPSQSEGGPWLLGTCGEKVCNAREKVKKGALYFQMAFEPVELDVKVVDLEYATPVVKQVNIR
jgi:hypothetical protein